MRILYLHQYFNTPEMPGSTRSYEMGRRLVDAGHEVHMITSDREASGRRWRVSEEAGMTVHWAPVPYSNFMGYRQRMQAFMDFALRAASRASFLRGDVVFATSTPLTIALPAVWAARRMKAPMVLEVRDLWPAVPIALGVLRDPISQSSARWLERFAYRNSSRVVALAPGMKDGVCEHGYPPELVTVIPNGSDLDVFTSDGTAGRAIRASMPWLGDRPLVLYAGTLGIANGADYLARVAAKTLEIDPEVRFVLVGDGKQEAFIRTVALDLGVLNKNFFMVGATPKARVAAWMDAADLAIAMLTGPEIVWRDSTSNKFFDALAAGKPIANNFEGWSAKVARDAGAGLIVPSDDLDEAARMIAAHVRDREWLTKAGRTARKLAENDFNRDTLASELERVLISAVGDWARGQRKPHRVS